MVLDAFRARLGSIIGGFDAAQSHLRMRGFRATRAHVNTLIADRDRIDRQRSEDRKADGDRLDRIETDIRSMRDMLFDAFQRGRSD